MRTTTKILDASSGNSEAFSLQEQKFFGKLFISGSPSANIKAFVITEDSGAKLLKIACPNWNGASLILKAKSDHADDTTYDETGVIYTENTVEQIELFQSI